MVEERVSSQATAQYVWGLRYVHAPVLRDADTDDDGDPPSLRSFGGASCTDANMNLPRLRMRWGSTWLSRP